MIQLGANVMQSGCGRIKLPFQGALPLTLGNVGRHSRILLDMITRYLGFACS